MTETQLQTDICDYIRFQYPKVLFTSDSSGIRLTIGQAKQMKRLRKCNAWPDLFIAEPIGKYHGCFIELKIEGTNLHKKNGEWLNQHIFEQNEVLKLLLEKGYYANFGIGFEHTKKIIDVYMCHTTQETKQGIIDGLKYL